MVEVIEHLEEPVAVMENALRLLSPGGSIVLTTPNRSFFGYDEPWSTDLPPVHLWWFSEDSINAIAERVSCSVEFVDFTGYNALFPILYAHRSPLTPMLGGDGKLIRRESFPISLARRLGILHEAYWLASRTARILKPAASSRRPTLVAAIKPV
jgi:SAM-dependent methyltransferase